MDKTIQRLKNVITNNQFVNCYSSKFVPGYGGAMEQFLKELQGEVSDNLYVDIDIDLIEECEGEEHEANIILSLINSELSRKGEEIAEVEALSISDAICKWSHVITNRMVLILHFFSDPYSENEKNILRSIRKALRSDLSAYLKILIISNRAVSRWELYHESNLDERHVKFFEV